MFKNTPLFLKYTALVFLFVAPASRAELIDKVAATVNSDVILMSDVNRFRSSVSLRQELDPIFGFNDDLSSGSISNSRILEFLIQEKLILQNIKVSDPEVEQEIQSIQKNNNLSHEQLIGFLKSKGYNFEQYFELMRVGLAKRVLLDRDIRTRVSISDDDVRNHYFNMIAKNNANTSLDYAIELIVIETQKYRSNSEAEAAAKDALRAVRQGEKFSTVASRFSETSEDSTPEFVPSDHLAEPIKSTVKKLQIGQISEVIKTAESYIIVRLADIRSGDSERFIQMKEQIREQLAKEEYKKQLVLWAERSRNAAFIHNNL